MSSGRPEVGKRRAVVVSGCRTPFCKAGTSLEELDILELARAALLELLHRSELSGEAVDQVILGNVARPLAYHNLAREAALAAGLPPSVPATSVSVACVSACQAITDGVNLIERGQAEVVVAGGAESLSNVPLTLKPSLARKLARLARARTSGDRLRTLARIRPGELLPQPPALREASTGLTMGQSAEIMAHIHGLSREEQDAYALESHRRAVGAWESGLLQREVAPVYLPASGGRAVVRDNHPREDTSLDKLAALPPVFDRQVGTITAGNASPLSDGAAVVLLMEEARAQALGHRPLAAVRSYAYAAVDPEDELLIAPAHAIPRALERARLTLGDVDLVEMHEAFAAQVLATLRALASTAFARERLGRGEAVGEIDPSRMNLRGGSIALGHPFGATGARLVTTLSHELASSQASFGLVSVCGAGGLGCAMILERAA